MNIQEIKSIIMKELPHIMQTDEEVRRFIIHIGREQFADKDESARRFDRIMDELAEQRRQSDKKWEDHRKEWEEYLQESKRKSEEHRKEWEEHRKEHEVQLQRLEKKYDSTIGALGARWGLTSEQSFRNALKGILEEDFGVEVINITDYDHEGTVFGRPEQIELDIIIKNGLLIICELKSSMSRGDMYIFERKVRFYEKKHGKEASKMIVISPMVDNKAKTAAEKIGILVYSGTSYIESL